MLHSRMKRVEELLLHETAKVLSYDLRDPRVGLVSVTGVKVSKDLREAIVYVSVLDDDPGKATETLQALESARGYVKRLLGERITLKRLPDLQFKLDETTKHAFHLFEVMDRVREEAADAASDRSQAEQEDRGGNERGTPD